jgi:hypothetical protein
LYEVTLVIITRIPKIIKAMAPIGDSKIAKKFSFNGNNG